MYIYHVHRVSSRIPAARSRDPDRLQSPMESAKVNQKCRNVAAAVEASATAKDGTSSAPTIQQCMRSTASNASVRPFGASDTVTSIYIMR